jgi:hypothetical protein
MDSRPAPASLRRFSARLVLGLALAACAIVPARAETVTEVEVLRVKPKKLKHETLQFLKENRDFIRARFDLLKEKQTAREVNAGEIDPRYLEYQRMLAAIFASKDSVSRTEDELKRKELLASITQLGQLETQLDLMDRQLKEQRGRLAVLQEDFVGDQRTALIVVATGLPAGAVPGELAVTLEDGPTLKFALTAGQQEVLRKGGALELFHGFVEPREQVVQVSVGGDNWPAGDTGYVSLEPARDRLMFLKLDLSHLVAEPGAPSIEATIWLHDAKPLAGDS